VGRNGVGKSTFINALTGQKSLNSGQILLNDQRIEDLSVQEKSKLISVVYTKPEVFGNYSVLDVIGLGRLPYQNAFGSLSEQDIQIVKKAVRQLDLEELQHHLFNTLSDGEKQIVMIGRAIAQDTPCIILDEPTAFLDIVNRRRVIEILNDIANDLKKLVIFSTHDVELISKHCDGLLWISKEKLKFTKEKRKFDQEINTLFNL